MKTTFLPSILWILKPFVPVKLLRYTLLLLLAFYGNHCFAQKSYSTSQLLSKNISNPGRALLQENLQYLRESNQSLPLVKEYSFRTETDEMDANRQEYLIRMNFNNKAANEVQDKKTRSQISSYELKDQILREKELIQRYEYITKWYFADNELEWFAEKRALLEDKKKIYKKMMSNSLNLDLDDLLKTEEDLQKLDQEMLELMHEKSFSIKQLIPTENNPEDYSLQANNWISLETIQQVLGKIATSQSPTLEQDLQQNDIALAKLDYDMEVAEADKVLDFVQLKYAGRDNLSIQRELSLGLSIVIPTKSTNRIGINKAKLDIFDEVFRLERLQQEMDEDITAAYANFEHLMEQRQLILKYISENQLEDTYDKYRANGTVHPLTLLRIKDSILKNQRELHKIEKAACLLFIDILAIKGFLSKTPTVNYLTDDLSSF